MKNESPSWTTYTSPFDQELWRYLITSSMFLSIIIWILHKFPKEYATQNLPFNEAIWITISAIFGITIRDANDTHSKNTGRFTLFIIFLCGSGFFSGYQAYLTSALAIPNEFWPFRTPNELVQTDYK